MKNKVLAVMMTSLALLFAMPEAVGQWQQNKACPGWNNPISFTSGRTATGGGYTMGYYSGQGGSLTSSGKQCPNPLDGTTGFSLNTLYTASQLASQNTGNCSNSIPSPANQFVIMTNTSGYDPNTGNNLKYVPTQFNTYDTTPGVINTNISKSIRIGDGCSNGSSNWTSDNGGAALYYTMYVNSQNAMLYLYYAVVAESPTHGMIGNPTFIIRIMKKRPNGTWQQVSDTLAYYVSSAETSTTSETCPNLVHLTIAQPGQNGWHNQGTGYNQVKYKDWDKVAINLNNLLYDTVRVEAMIYDCFYNAHYAYAYIAGECREMKITATGCPVGRSTDVTTLSAPRGMRDYAWSASRFGVSELLELSPGGTNSHYSFRPLTSGNEASGAFRYNVSADDFRITRRTRTVGGHDSVIVDSIGMEQTFRCDMTSAIDPNKPYKSSIYVNVTNTKPTIAVDSLSYCNGDVKLHSLSHVSGNRTMLIDSLTRWSFYNNANCGGSPDTVIFGDSAVYNYNTDGHKGVVVRTYTDMAQFSTTDTASCWSEAQYIITPKHNPTARMTVNPRTLCDSAETTITDVSDGVYRRMWTFLKPDADPNDPNPPLDTLIGYYNDEQSLTRGFTHNIEPITLTVRNGKYYLNPYNQRDTIWCQDTAYDTVAVFVHPDLLVTGDTIVCQGSRTDAYVRALGVDNCTYEWSNSYGIITGNIPEGNHLAVAPYADTAVYYVRVTTQEGCVAWDSIHAYLVRPVLTMRPDDGRICPGDIAVLTGSSADHYTWTASPSDPSLAGQDSLDVIRVSPSRTTVYTMVGHGTNDCDASPLTKTVTVVPLPVPRITTSPEFVDTDNPTITLRDVSPNGVRTVWQFHDGDTSNARNVVHTFDESVGADSVYVLLTSYNVLDCPSDKVFGVPVRFYSAWFPNIFTPGSEDENAKFRLYSNMEYEVFHIYIYNRGGQLLFESTDPDFEWDGTYNGDPCPQGAYVYVCNYRKPDTPTLVTRNGSITLVR